MISKKDNIKVQEKFVSPYIVYKDEFEEFRQKILKEKGNRDYAIVTIMAYAGLKISEVLNLKLNDVDLL